VEHLAFSRDGRWLASIDTVGNLRIHGGFSSNGLPQVAVVDPFRPAKAASIRPELPLVIATSLENVQEIIALEGTKAGFIISRSNAPVQAFGVTPPGLPNESHLGPGVTTVAWNSDSTELCAISLTDIYWLHSNPLNVFCVAAGKNPFGVASAGGFGKWALPTDNLYVEYEPMLEEGEWSPQGTNRFSLVKVEKGQAVRSAMAATSDGRIAIYQGRRIQFFAGHKPAPKGSSLPVSGTNRFREIFWDQPGRLLGVVFSCPDGSIRLETWTTSTNFPPKCQDFDSVPLAAGRIGPANDGSHCIVRSSRKGLLRLDPGSTNSPVVIDASSTARQDAPFAASHDGAFLALVADRNRIQLLRLPEGRFFAELPNSHPSAVVTLAWDSSARRLAGVTEDGYVQVWDLAAWQEWLAKHGLQN
jgi:WD40 repeat protein